MTNKYNSHRVKADGHTFDSKAEYKRFCELQLLQKVGEIDDIEIHPSFPIAINGVKICKVELDFSYRILKPKKPFKRKYEDVKGVDTAVSKLKRKMFRAAYPDIDLEILYSARRK